jgi:hypothetical protein
VAGGHGLGQRRTLSGGTWSPGLILAHNDATTHNAAWYQGRLTGALIPLELHGRRSTTRSTVDALGRSVLVEEVLVDALDHVRLLVLDADCVVRACHMA